MKILKELKRLADCYGLDYDVDMEGHPAHHFQYIAYYLPTGNLSKAISVMAKNLKDDKVLHSVDRSVKFEDFVEAIVNKTADNYWYE